MRCEQAQKMMTARLDGSLDVAEAALLDEHLTVCADCRAEWVGLQALEALLSAAPPLPAPASFRERLMARLDRQEQVRRRLIAGPALVLGTISLILLTLAPVAARVSNELALLVALLTGQGVALGHFLLTLLTDSAGMLLFLFAGSLLPALALNGLWLKTVMKINRYGAGTAGR